jgi:hypothetical protein
VTVDFAIFVGEVHVGYAVVRFMNRKIKTTANGIKIVALRELP